MSDKDDQMAVEYVAIDVPEWFQPYARMVGHHLQELQLKSGLDFDTALPVACGVMLSHAHRIPESENVPLHRFSKTTLDFINTILEKTKVTGPETEKLTQIKFTTDSVKPTTKVTGNC